MLARRLRRRANIEPTLVFAGADLYQFVDMHRTRPCPDTPSLCYPLDCYSYFPAVYYQNWG